MKGEKRKKDERKSCNQSLRGANNRKNRRTIWNDQSHIIMAIENIGNEKLNSMSHIENQRRFKTRINNSHKSRLKKINEIFILKLKVKRILKMHLLSS